MYVLARSKTEIDDILNICIDRKISGENPFFGMTYDQGVAAGIRWLVGEESDPPVTEGDGQ